ncbi:CpaD family pilus assembly protein [Sphingomonas mollis]|uniref:CpaD family pilus assembly protein n=1 Tax=Sphingomonas mollis TaxID=2795726 RepID=A0ABS0XL12_9SPHN|nr:CpaD family pilus assembly protein [Sphingomonas sp. BT553]MBJ6120721.1 CpaD family pilus assembly protein [Sphingomonas sp. BT553]
MTTRSLLLACLIPALAVSGCTGTRNRGLESVHQPVVARTDYVLDLQTAGGSLASGEAQRLQGWLAGLRTGYGDRIAIDDPAAGSRDAVAEIVSGFGLLLADDAPVSAGTVAPGTVRIVVSRMRAHVPGCPDWSRDSSVDYEQNTSSGYGCSTNSNLAAMIANPQDLIRGAGASGMADPMTVYKSIDLFRKAAPSGGGGANVKAESAGGK